MKIYWSIKSLPELKEMSEEERKAIFRQSWAKASRNWRTWILFVLLVVFWWGLWKVLVRIFGDIVGTVIGIIVGSAIVGFTGSQFIINKTLPYIREQLKSVEKASNIHDRK